MTIFLHSACVAWAGSKCFQVCFASSGEAVVVRLCLPQGDLFSPCDANRPVSLCIPWFEPEASAFGGYRYIEKLVLLKHNS